RERARDARGADDAGHIGGRTTRRARHRARRQVAPDAEGAPVQIRDGGGSPRSRTAQRTPTQAAAVPPAACPFGSVQPDPSRNVRTGGGDAALQGPWRPQSDLRQRLHELEGRAAADRDGRADGSLCLGHRGRGRRHAWFAGLLVRTIGHCASRLGDGLEMERSLRISGVGSALPEYRYPQEILTQAFKKYWGSRLENPEQFERLHAHMKVATRHLAYPMHRYLEFTTFGDTNAAWFEAAQKLGERAIDNALEHAGLSRRDLHALFVVSVTGVASPSLDARLINRMDLRPDIKRTPIFGVGCV